MKIEHFKPVTTGGALKASFQVSFNVAPWGNWFVNMTFFQKDSGQTWFGYPQKEYTSKEGERKFFKMAFPSEQAREGFEAQLKNALGTQVEAMRPIFPPKGNEGRAPVENYPDEVPF